MPTPAPTGTAGISTPSCGFVAIDEPLARQAGDLATQHALRGYDAVHLACALNIESDDMPLATLDNALLEGALHSLAQVPDDVADQMVPIGSGSAGVVGDELAGCARGGVGPFGRLPSAPASALPLPQPPVEASACRGTAARLPVVQGRSAQACVCAPAPASKRQCGYLWSAALR
jgi:hypothetical protein